MRISEVAHLSGVPARTLRFYETQRLLAPPQRLANGYRDYTPEWQVAFVHGGVINEGKVVITRKGDVTFYEIQLPPNEASPLAMKPGTAFGLGLTANDADVESVRRQSITNTPQGTEPHSNPDLWPHAVLTDK